VKAFSNFVFIPVFKFFTTQFSGAHRSPLDAWVTK
jgi:hypothetical protein